MPFRRPRDREESPGRVERLNFERGFEVRVCTFPGECEHRSPVMGVTVYDKASFGEEDYYANGQLASYRGMTV